MRKNSVATSKPFSTTPASLWLFSIDPLKLASFSTPDIEGLEELSVLVGALRDKKVKDVSWHLYAHLALSLNAD